MIFLFFLIPFRFDFRANTPAKNEGDERGSSTRRFFCGFPSLFQCVLTARNDEAISNNNYYCSRQRERAWTFFVFGRRNFRPSLLVLIFSLLPLFRISEAAIFRRIPFVLKPWPHQLPPPSFLQTRLLSCQLNCRVTCDTKMLGHIDGICGPNVRHAESAFNQFLRVVRYGLKM